MPGERKIYKAGVIDVSALAEAQARDVADQKMTESKEDRNKNWSRAQLSASGNKTRHKRGITRGRSVAQKKKFLKREICTQVKTPKTTLPLLRARNRQS